VNLTDTKILKALLERHGLTPTKKFGQHFLVSQPVVDKIILAALADPVPASILEVGPGPGVLTRPLSEAVSKLVAYEVDEIAVSALNESAPLAEVRGTDFLSVDLYEEMAGWSRDVAIVSNMPYNITGPLLTSFTRLRPLVSRAVLMMQLEVGQKILSKPGDRAMGSISVFLQSRWEISKVCDAPSGAFFPPPKVQSIVLQFVPKPEFHNESKHESVVRQGFSQPRKTLVNNLRGTYPMISEVLIAMNIDVQIRPHQLSLDQWFSLVDKLTA
jgi:16S rRNA (adenine1518-N6/adenine1519-N6)-dimethyltransferase